MPVLTTSNVPRSSIKEHNAGWYIEDNKAELKTLKEIFEIKDDQIWVKSRNAYTLANKYNWDNIMPEMEKMYKSFIKIMNILFVGKARLEFGGPSLEMSNLKKKININKFDNVEILDIDKFDIKTIFEILFFKKFENYLFKFDLVHFHELWSPYIILFAYKSQRLGIPYFFTFHGVLNKWSLKKNNILKKFFLKIFSKYIFKISHAFHFLNKKEFDEVKILSKYFNNKSFVLKNGIEIENKILKKNFTNKNDIIDLLYFGRIHPKKGIIDLINMFKIIKKIN